MTLFSFLMKELFLECEEVVYDIVNIGFLCIFVLSQSSKGTGLFI